MPEIYINLETEALKKENESLKAQLAALTDAIKRCQGTFILDGNDLYDWGWMTCEMVNAECRRRWGYGLHEYPNTPEVQAVLDRYKKERGLTQNSFPGNFSQPLLPPENLNTQIPNIRFTT